MPFSELVHGSKANLNIGSSGAKTIQMSLSLEEITSLVKQQLSGRKKAGKICITGPVRKTVQKTMLDLVRVHKVCNQKLILPMPLADGAPSYIENEALLYNSL
ncbi:uncharacterized protein PHACADRAFT_197969 [Phanerochaete carnosa HHB-10118-sp]|uniref:Uncharacterized protein n=1 Tax=Phanerochaete carnosa (strain HHB-10118-sp) TaxID=650164 RepID=K5WSZ1_PHACS|nr:uncharacterized protein PHACADRAFT_197969 [Phanerochaete carnosa HHB-10118-sp]EKM53542.1 hypothetical protein PHACADRAFT_197969 [Phanerochaete carnosa HHB-10118-sp]